MREPRVLQPADLSSLVEALGRTTPASRVIAGATDLMLNLRQATQWPDLLLDLSGVQALRGIRAQGARLHVGAMTRFDELARDATVRHRAACLAQAAASVGSMQIRGMATVGGNVANASACADTVPALLVLRSDVGMLTRRGAVERRPLVDVLDAASRRALAHDEVLFDFSFDLPGAGQRSGFAKLGARSAVTIAKLNAALVVECTGPDEVVTQARVAFGSLAPVAMVDPRCSEPLLGRPLGAESIQGFAEACAALVDRAIPRRASRGYKRMAIRGLAHDVVAALR